MIGKHMTNPLDYPVADLIWHVMMMQTWPFIPADLHNWNTPAWSVSAEWFAYLTLFPLSVWLASLTFLRRYGLNLLLLLAFLAIYLTYNQLTSESGLTPTSCLMRVSSEYLAGSLMFLWYLDSTRVASIVAARLDYLVLAFVLLIWFSSFIILSNWNIILTIPVIIVGLTQESALTAKILSLSFFRYLGRVSYALYLIHAIAQRMLHVFIPYERYSTGPLLLKYAVLLGYLIFPLLLAMLIYHFIEEPCRLAIRRWSTLRTQR
jgi:peptidoglycan/LPS O-acetylase OafA/YrhL